MSLETIGQDAQQVLECSSCSLGSDSNPCYAISIAVIKTKEFEVGATIYEVGATSYGEVAAEIIDETGQDYRALAEETCAVNIARLGLTSKV